MLNLAATESLQGNAGTGSVITYTVTGMEITAGVEAYKVLSQGSLAAVTGALYTTPGSKQGFVKKIHLLNTSALPILVALFVNGTAGTNQFGRLLIPANGSADYVGEGWNVYDSSGFRQYVGATGPTGAKGAQYIGIYSAAVNYVIDNIVSDNGTAWIALAANGPSAGVHAPPTIPTTFNTWWSLLASKGDQGIQGIQGNPGVVTTINANNGLTGGGSAATINLAVQNTDGTITVTADDVSRAAITTDVSVPAASNVATIQPNVVSDTKLRDSAGTSVIGKGTSGSGDPGDIVAGSDDIILRRTSGVLAFGAGNDTIHGTRGGGTLHPDVVAAGASGFMTGADKTKLNAITGTHTGNNTGDVTLGASGTTPNANAASLAAQVLTLQTGSTAFAGLMSTADKTKLTFKWTDVVAELGLDKTGANATTNTTLLQAAMSDSTFTGGGVCFFPAGTYAFNGTITVSKAIIFVGAGRSITNLRMDDVQKTHFALTYGSQCAGFEQLRFTGGTTGLERTGRPVKTTIAAGSADVVLPPAGSVLNITSATGLAAATPANPQHLQYEANFPLSAGTPYWGTLTYTGISGNQLTGVTTAPTAAGRFFKTGQRIQQGGFAIDLGDIPNTYIQQCDILFHKNGVRSAGALQFIDDCNIREMNNAGRQAGVWGAAGSAIDTTEAEASQCIHVDGFGDRYLRRVTTDNAGDWAFMAGVRVSQCASCVLTDCNIINMNWAMDIFANGGVNTAVASVMALNSFFDSSTIGLRIRCATGTDTAQRIRFVQCWMSTQTTAGASIEHANCSSIDFIGCDFFQSPIGLDVTAAGDWGVRASRFSGATTAGIRTTAGATNRFTISDNFIGNGGGFGANALGINIQAGAYLAYQIADNRGLDTNTTPGITDLGTVAAPGEKTVRDNLGTGNNTYETGTRTSFTVSTVNVVVGQFPIVQPNLAYGFDAQVLAHISATNATGVGVGLILPAGATMDAMAIGPLNTIASVKDKAQYFTATGPQNSFITTTGITGQLRVSGAVVAGTATSHTGLVQFIVRAQVTATVRAGSWFRAFKL